MYKYVEPMLQKLLILVNFELVYESLKLFEKVFVTENLKIFQADNNLFLRILNKKSLKY